MADADVYQVAVNQSLYGVSCVNTFTFVATQDGPNEAVDLLELFDLAVLPTWGLTVSDSLSFNCLVARNLSQPGNAPTEKTALSTQTGSTGPDALPANAVAVIGLYGPNPTKTGRGRKFISGMLVLDEEDNCFKAAPYALLEALKDKFIADVGADGGPNGWYQPVIAGGDPPTPFDVDLGRVNTQVRKHRSRTTRRGCAV